MQKALPNTFCFDVSLRFRFNPTRIRKGLPWDFNSWLPSWFLSFLWFDDIFKDIAEVTKYRLSRVIFGFNCSQYLLNSVLRFHTSKHKDVDKMFSEKVAKIFSVHVFNSTAKDISESIEIYKNIKYRFLDKSFKSS